MLEINMSNPLCPLPPQPHMPRENTNAHKNNLLRPLRPRYSKMPQGNEGDAHTDANEIVKNADNWQLSQNPIYHNLQKAVAKRTHERDVYK
jgi:hypothetical protein